MAKINWLNTYNVRKLQQGGQMDPNAGAAAPQEAAPQGGAEANLEQMLAQYAQTRDPKLAVQICDLLVQAMAQQQQQQGGAPQGAAPAAKFGGRIPRGPIFHK